MRGEKSSEYETKGHLCIFILSKKNKKKRSSPSDLEH